MKSHKLLTFAVAAIMATSGLSTMIPTQSALASGPSQGAQSQHVGPMTCVPFSGRPGSSGQLPLGVIPPNWGTDGWQRMDSTSRSDLPSKIVMRDNTEGFNQRMDFALRDGKVYGRFQSENQWRHIDTPSCLDGHISAISVNDAMLTLSIPTVGCIALIICSPLLRTGAGSEHGAAHSGLAVGSSSTTTTKVGGPCPSSTTRPTAPIAVSTVMITQSRWRCAPKS